MPSSLRTLTRNSPNRKPVSTRWRRWRRCWPSACALPITCATAPPSSASCGWVGASVSPKTAFMPGCSGQPDKEAVMAYITKRGGSYSVRYTYLDEHGKNCDKWESFPTKEEAMNRKKQVEHELASGTFLIPSTVTVGEFLMDWLPKQCSKHKWAPKTYQSNLSTIQNL